MGRMVLAPHAICGAAVAILLRRHPVLGLAAAFASHFVLNLPPHWHYELESLHRNPADRRTDYMVFYRTFLRDLGRTGLDAAIGLTLTLALVAHRPAPEVALGLAGAALGLLPDLLQLAYYRFPRSPLRHLQRFHRWVHVSTDLDSWPAIGITAQLATVILAFYLTRFVTL